MIHSLEKYRIFIKPGNTDFRKAVNGLSLIVEEQMNEKLFEKSLFVFCNKSKDKLKILYWDDTGFCLWYKRLEKNKFPWPKSEKEKQILSYKELQMLLKGIDFFNAHEKITFSSVS